MTQGSRLEYALLGLLKQGPKSGYDLRKVFSSTPMRHFSDSPGSIYPALKRMEKRGWVRFAQEKGNARGRQVFSVTASGANELIRWIRQRITKEDIIWRSEELTLRFALMDGNMKRSDALQFLQDMERETEAYVHELKQFSKSVGPDFRQSTGGLVFEFGIESYEAQRKWAHRTYVLLSEEDR